MKKLFAYVIVAVMLSACGVKDGVDNYKSIEGSYASKDGKGIIDVKSDGYLHYKNLSSNDVVVMRFVVTKGRLEFKTVDGFNMSLEVNEDGSLTSNLGDKFTKL